MTPSATKKHVLIVEDDSMLQQALHRKMIHADFEVSAASDGQEGLDAALSKHPDLILMDLIMPCMNGASMMSHLRNDEWGKNVPIIILTNQEPNDQMIAQLMTDQPSYYLIKTNTQLEEVVLKAREVLAITN